MNTSYVSVKAEELQTACELWLDQREDFIENNIQREIETAMIENIGWFKKKYRTKEEAFEWVHSFANVVDPLNKYSRPIIDVLQNYKSEQAERIEKILYACKVPHYGFVNLSVEDNAILEGYYEQ